MLSMIFFIVALILLSVVGSFIPIGNDKSTVRRLPWVTFAIMAANVIIFYVTLPIIGVQLEELANHAGKLQTFMTSNPEMAADKEVRKKLVEAGMMTKDDADGIAQQIKVDAETESQYSSWLSSGDADRLREEFNQKLSTFTNARKELFWSKYGLGPNGDWKFYQLVTSAFLHGGNMHLWLNLLCFFAIAFSLEDLWGRGIFLALYLIGAAASCIPSIVQGVGLIGASGAISATMGAFLIRLPKTRIRLLCIPVLAPVWWLRLLIGRKQLIVIVPGYLFLAAYFIAQVLSPIVEKKLGSVSTTAYSAHIAGFVFGAAFALIMKATKAEETHINPKIEAKVSFSAAPAVNQAIEMLDRGDVALAERKLRAHLAQQADDTNGLLALIQVYQKVNNFDQLNAIYGRLIRVHLSKNDKEAALYAYDNLLSAFPDNNVAVNLPARDWLAICEYLRESGLNREAGVEYERFLDAHPNDPLAAKAAVQGGEAALLASDTKRALKLFEKAEGMTLTGSLASRALVGVEKARRIIAASPGWTKKEPPKGPAFAKSAAPKAPIHTDREEEEVPV
ncbi:MAG TPA: rhomboid family intramembrane serine protease [Blastocatellia bacterium]|nr:rhomboid family intramembrane serine protease [Blastocatellia bacterium]